MAKSVTVSGTSYDDKITTDWDYKWSSSKFAWRYWGEATLSNTTGSSTHKTDKKTVSFLPSTELVELVLYFDGGAGNDDINLDKGWTGYLTGGADNDSITGYNGTFDGGADDDYIKIKKEDGEKQRVDAFGGGGTDTLDLSSFSKNMTVVLGTASTFALEGDREVTHDGAFENYIGTTGNEDITAVTGGSVISSGKGDDTLRGQGGHDYLDPGDVNTGDQDTIYTGGGWDVVYLGDIGSANQDYTQDPTSLSIWAELGVDPDNLQGEPGATFWEEFLADDDLVGASLKMVPVVGKYLSLGYDLVNFFLGSNDKSKTVDGGDASSFVKVMDFDARYDQVILPLTSFDVPTPTSSNLYEYLDISLDAENGGTFAQLYFDDTFVSDYAAAVGITIGSGGKSLNDVASALWDNLWLSRTKFSHNENGTVEAYQGSQQLTGVDSQVKSFLDAGEHMSIFGNVGGYYIEANYDAPYVTGSAQDDWITFYNTNVSATNGPGAYMVAGFEGNDYLQVRNATQNIVFNGGADFDIISFTNMVVSNSNDGSYANGVTFNLGDTSEQIPGSTGLVRIENVEGVEGTTAADNLTGSDGGDLLMGLLGNDTLDGGSGSDTIRGGGGDDMLTGGGDADDFTFASGFGSDTITDFSSEDSLIFEGLDSGTINDLNGALAGAGSVLSIGSDQLTLTGFDITNLTAHYTTNTDGTQDVTIVGTTIRAEDPTPLSDFEAVMYLASYDDLIEAFGYNLTSAKAHYETNGRSEGRQITFDAEQYLANYTDLAAAYGSDSEAAASHYVQHGFSEGRSYAGNLTDGLSASAATQSSDASSSTGASQVLDGSTDTFNHTAGGDPDQWLAIDLGGDALIDGIEIANRNDGDASHQAIVTGRLEGATVEVYDDGVLVSQSALSSDVTQRIALNGVVGDEVRLYSNDGDHLHVAEVDVFGYVNLTDTLASSAATQSSLYSSSYTAANVLDGAVDTFNHTARNDASPWLAVDLGEDAVIELIELENRQDNWTSSRLAGANIEVIDDGVVVWTSADLGTAHNQTIIVDGIVGDEVRINHADGNYLHVAEIDIFGALLA